MQNKWYIALMALFIGVPLMLAFPSDSDARRLGGGKTFGSKPAYSKRSTDTSSTSASKSQTAASQKNDGIRQQLSRRGGLMGLLGGLALGGLLGSLLFGGAFENMNFFDILILGGLAFLAWKFFQSRKPRQQQTASANGAVMDDNGEPLEDYRLYKRQPHFSQDDGAAPSRDFDTDLMKDKQSAGASDSEQDAGFDAADPAVSYDASSLPEGFDKQSFLQGAEAAYRSMQKAWDDGDMSELRGLMTDRVFVEVQDQFHQRGDGENRTEVLKLEAQLLQARERSGQLEASVMFDAVLTESAAERPQQVREIWHFIKPGNSVAPTWFLDGIQQLD